MVTPAGHHDGKSTSTESRAGSFDGAPPVSQAADSRGASAGVATDFPCTGSVPGVDADATVFSGGFHGPNENPKHSSGGRPDAVCDPTAAGRAKSRIVRTNSRRISE
jgi:hypothetical protein